MTKPSHSRTPDAPRAARPDAESPTTRTRGHELIDRALQRATPGPAQLPEGAMLNMELSNLAFQERVLELASDASYPLLERVRFVSIFGSNLDEFFLTRVAGFKRQLALGNRKRTLDGILPTEQLRLIRERADGLLNLVYREILPGLYAELREHGIEILRAGELSDGECAALHWQYGPNLDTLLTPLPVDRGRPFPHVRNLRPALIVQLRAGGAPEQLYVLALPGDAPALVPLFGGRRFVPLEEVLRMDLARLFAGSEVSGAYLFRVTRSGNLSLDPDAPQDIVSVVEAGVALRPFQPVVRLEVEEAMPPALEERLRGEFAEEAKGRSSHLGGEDVYRVAGLVDLMRLEQVATLPIPELRFPAQRRTTPVPSDVPMFERIRQEPVLVRFPRHTFEGTVERFIREAAADADVEEIRITLYRTSRNSRIVRLLSAAHRRGKRVVAFVEVKASFDERRNIEWARSLEAVGIQVLYGPPSLKVHAKVALVRRREGGQLTTYSYIGTGNLNAATAGAYTDLGLLTADSAVGAELLDVFDALADEPAVGEFRHLVAAPFNMRQRFVTLIERETEHARAGRGGRITAKLNGIADREVIAALYAASRAGVRIDLVVRGICSLRPGVEGLSENIRVVSNAGRYLEHSRIFRFRNGGDPEHFIGSADWRGRNLSRRVEVIVPVHLPPHRRALDRILAERLRDGRAWDLQPSGEYRRRGASPAPA
jgi:polyphosphate kinase